MKDYLTHGRHTHSVVFAKRGEEVAHVEQIALNCRSLTNWRIVVMLAFCLWSGQETAVWWDPIHVGISPLKKTLASVSFNGARCWRSCRFQGEFICIFELHNKTARCRVAGFLRFQYWNLSHLSCQPSMEIILSRTYELLTNRLPFGCDKSMKQHLPAALKSQKKMKKNGGFIRTE